MPLVLQLIPPLFVGLFGLAFGSFANVVIWRYPRGESLSVPGSHCTRCDTPIAWYDNVPVLSWLLLRGKCRVCGEPISMRYPLVELGSGALWLLAYFTYGLTLRCAFAIAFFYLLLILSAIDIDTMRLPNGLVGLLLAIGVVGVAVSAVSSVSAVPLTIGPSGIWGQPVVFSAIGLLASAGLAGGVAALYALARNVQGFGMGDIKLLAVIGVFLGLYGMLVLFVASVAGSVVNVIGLRSGGKSLATKVPFGPYLAGAAVVVAIWGPAAWAWYMGLLVR